MRFVNRAAKFFLAACLLFAVALLFTNVTLRYFWKSAIFWAEEMLRYLIVWITFIGASMCVQEESHIGIDVLSNILHHKGKLVLKLILNIVGFFFGVAFLIVSFRFIQKVYAMGQVSATIGNVPMYIIYLCFPISFFLYALQSMNMFLRLMKLRRQEGGQL